MRMSDVVSVAEGVGGKGALIRIPNGGSENAADFLVCRLFTDAIFNEDIRAIQLIIDRIDGGLPKDIDMDGYRTQFSDCFNEIMQMESASQIKLLPGDTVMMALCKALYALSVQDIYWDPDEERKRKPSAMVKQERDAALRMVLERTGGRKTMSAASVEHQEIESADWIKNLALPE